MKKQLFYLTALVAVLAFASCSKDATMGDEAVVTPDDEIVDTGSNLTTVTLANFSGNSDRVSYPAATRAEEEAKPAALKLVAEIANPSKAEGFNLVEFEGRYLSATSVYYNEATKTYYTSYHMQGNNYNTELGNEIGGAIQAFKVENDEVELLDGFRAANPNQEDYDFNHIYFDQTAKRIIVVGHNWKVPSSWTSSDPYTGKRDNTQAIIGVFHEDTGELTYSTIQTDKKAYDEAGHSLGYTDAGDANCVVRPNDAMSNGAYGWNFYFVATRKGFAVLDATEENLFKPALNADGSNYFIATPGSAKYIAATGTSSWYGALYLSENYTPEEGDITAATKSEARIAHFSVNTNASNGFGSIQTWKSPFTQFNPQTTSILEFGEQDILPEVITPVDGKNTLCILGDSEFYAALGTSGLYCNNGVDGFNGVKKFGNRPVNCVAVDNEITESGYSNKGYLYVANGAKLTILDRKTMEEVASWNVPTKDGNGNDLDVAASANYVLVNKADNGERTITVAFGQEGVKIFKFDPANL